MSRRKVPHLLEEIRFHWQGDRPHRDRDGRVNCPYLCLGEAPSQHIAQDR